MTPQAGIFSPLARFHRHFEYQLHNEVELAQLAPLITQVQANAAQVVIGFGDRLWRAAKSSNCPAELKPFTDIGPAKGTQTDIWLWVFGEDHSELIDRASALHQLVAPLAQGWVETEGAQYHQSRDRTGFEDGSGNPKTPEARIDAATIPTGEIGAGGCYVLTQKWQHAMQAFAQLSEPEQEQVIGRTKQDAIELTGDAMPADSHVSRTDLKINGVAQKVWRRSVPWGGVSEQGLYFVGFACQLSRLEVQLKSMFGLTDDGIQDALTRYSSPLRSAWWFAPSQEELASLTS